MFNLSKNISIPFYLLLVLVLFIYGLFPPAALAQINQSIEKQMLNLTYEGVSVQSEIVSGSINLANNSAKNLAEAYLVTKLISSGEPTIIKSNGQSISIMGPGQLIEFTKSDYFSVLPGDTINRSFQLKYPVSLKPGKYKLISEIKDKDNTSQGIVSQAVDLNGSDTFLQINDADCELKVGNTSYKMVEGPNVPSNQTATVNCKVINKSAQSVTAKPQVEYAVNSVADHIGTSQSFDINSSLTIAAGKTGLVTFSIPNNLSPQVYEGLLTLVNTSQQKISPSIPFRWIQTGPSAVINAISLDKSYYKAGETAKISVSALPSMDLSWRGGSNPKDPGYSPTAGTDLKKPKLSLKVINESQQVCGEKEQSMHATTDEIYWKEVSVDIAISTECKNPKVQAALYEEGITEPLAVLVKGEISTYDDLHPATANIVKKLGSWTTILVIFITLIVIALVGFLIWKKRQKPPTQPPTDTSSVATTENTSNMGKTVTALLIVMIGAGLYLFSQNKLVIGGPFTVNAQQTFGVIQGVAKTPVNNTADSTQTVTQKKFHDRIEGGPNPLEWANVRDFAENNTGGDSHITADSECKTVQITVNGTANSDYMCSNWGPGIAIANFVDGTPATPNNMSSSLGNTLMIPSIQIPPNTSIYNDSSVYGPHILNVYNLGVNGPKSVTYTLNFPNGLSKGQHKVLLQAGVSQTTIHASYNRFYSSLEPIVDGAGQLPDFNCDGKTPCFINLEHTITCGPPPVCNQSCTTKDDCAGAKDGCVDCRPNEAGQNVCQPPVLACNATCTNNKDCFGNKEGCTTCLPNAAGTGSVCSQPPACGVGCERDDQCAGSKDGCTVCAANDAGKKICQTPFDENACKCDGFNALNLQNPASSNFQFEAFGKVEGANTKTAQIKSIQFQMTKSTKTDPNNGTIVASSDLLTPEIVSSSADKIRYRSAWSVTPPAYDSNGVYRVFANIKCGRKSSTASASLNSVLGDNIYNSDNNQLIEKELNYSPIKLAQTNDNLELGTLKDGYFTKITETDSCRFIRFEYGQY